MPSETTTDPHAPDLTLSSVAHLDSKRRRGLFESCTVRLDKRVHALYLQTEVESGDVDDEEFRYLLDLRVECDPECNRLLRVLRMFDLEAPYAS